MLEITGVTAGYGGATVLQDVTLSVPSSTAVALLGPNGAGKTTLLRVASGLLKPVRGRVEMDGKDVTGMRTHAMARVGLCHIPEGRGIFPSLSVHDNLVLESPKGRERESIEEAVSAFPLLGTRLRQTAGSLSGGEQQMLALVRTFVAHPKVVVVDEPCLGLAPIVVDQIFAALRRIVESGAALLLVEQYVHRALTLATTAYLMNRGQIVFTGPSEELESEGLFERYVGVHHNTGKPSPGRLHGQEPTPRNVPAP
jgi:branched-chain amino acid transport system ATP-binding protein